MSEYKYPAADVFHQEEIKKSTFIVHIAHTPDLSSAKAFIKSIETKYADARHNCWAHVAGKPGGSHVYGFSDDGEPNGTAGKPMLNVLMGSGLGEVTAVVTRYFGGIKLGTGGLVRAYGGTLNNALANLSTINKVPSIELIGSSEYSMQGVIEQLLKTKYQVLNIDKQFTANIEWVITIDSRQATQAIQDIFDLSHGAVELTIKE
ncbi:MULTISPECIES: YigZ family protein [unclassified Pseudoalteromonas]|uniref:YigZ family protein n=1 Tax=unclassified Pseudoalteromonas TaxID=194690 RepID=UPI0015CD138D|nr:YigZ family protein [Pseudoalteromonas sp. MIP2626]NYR12792.1 YigZ family protein [Pseudoalteromonas sp. MIP2626]